MLRHIREYERFDLEGFLHHMELMVTNIAPWEDYTTKARLGTKVEVVITKDDTPYQPGTDGSVQTNFLRNLSSKFARTTCLSKLVTSLRLKVQKPWYTGNIVISSPSLQTMLSSLMLRLMGRKNDTTAVR